MPFLLLLNLIVPYVMILVGGILKKHPVSDMRSQNGYNTPTSRKSQAHWDYAQSIAPDIFISIGKTAGVVEIILCVILFLLHVSSQEALIAGGCVGVGFLLFGFYRTDSEVKKKFAEV
ncbi:MAG: SdpI family protein [Lachnospiraceae bacterium]|nr:SdpI family protein [Lachnospiraceae bacterium]MCM1238606.1 SdpI family protein [Lachnospiraceae bacterium]